MNSSICIHIKNIVALLVGATMLFSCKDDKLAVVNINATDAVPEIEIKDLTMTTTTNGKLHYIVKSPLVQRFTQGDDPYSVFPSGGYVESYNDSAQLETTIFAKYSMYVEKPTKLWIAYDSVVVHNLIKNQSLYTDTLFWDVDKQEIYTDSYVRIVLPNMELPSEKGMRSDDRFRDYELRTLRDSKVYYDKNKLGKNDSIP